MYKGIPNIEIEKNVKKIDKAYIDKNFVSVFPSDKMNKFINFHLIMKSKMRNIQF